MQRFTRFSLKFLLFVGLVFGFQVLISWVSPASVPEIELVKSYLKDGVEIIYFGDSTVTSYALTDQNKEDIAAILQANLPQWEVGRVSHSAYQMDIYKEYVQYISEKERLPKLMVVPINLRSFSPEWDMRPEYQFEKERRFLGNKNKWLLRMWDRPLAIFRWHQPEISRQAYEKTVVFDGEIPNGTVEEFEKVYLNPGNQEFIKKSFYYFYMPSLKPDHRKLQSMMEIARLAEASNIKVVFYVTPIDFQTGDAYIGNDLKLRIQENVDLIDTFLAETDAVVIDMSLDLDSSYFDWDGIPNEHLNEHGRQYVAAQISNQIVMVLDE